MTATAAPAPAQNAEGEQTRPARSSPTLTPYARWMCAITVIAGVGRLLYLQRFSFWRDEAFTGIAVRRSWSGMLDAVRHDSAPPFGYLLSHLMGTISTDPWALRLTSVLAGTAAVPVAGALARRISGDRAGLLGAAVAAVLPPFVVTARDARMYALATTLVMLSALTLWRALERPTWRRLLVYGISVTLAVYTHYLAVLGVIAQLAVALLLRPPPRAWLRACAVSAVAGLSLAPWLVAASAQFDHAGTPFWVRSVSLDGVTGTLTAFLAGQAVDQDAPGRAAITFFQAGSITAAVLGMLGAIFLFWKSDASRRRAISFVAGAALSGVALIVLVSLRQSFLEWRYTSVVWGPFTAVVGVGLARLRPRLLGGLGIGAMGAASFALMLGFTRGPDMPPVTAFLDARVGAGDQVLASSADYLLIVYEAQPNTAARTHVIATDVPWYWGTAAYPPGAVQPSVVDTGGTIYVVGDPGEAPPRLPAGYASRALWCARAVCATVYTR